MPGQNNIANNGRRTNGKRKRNYTPKVSTKNVETNAFAYNTTLPYVYSVLGDYLDSSPHNIKEIREYSKILNIIIKNYVIWHGGRTTLMEVLKLL